MLESTAPPTLESHHRLRAFGIELLLSTPRALIGQWMSHILGGPWCSLRPPTMWEVVGKLRMSSDCGRTLLGGRAAGLVSGKALRD